MNLRFFLAVTGVLAVPFILYAVDVQNGGSNRPDFTKKPPNISPDFTKKPPSIIENIEPIENVKVADDSNTKAFNYRTIEWETLIPPEELEMIANQPPIDVHDNLSLVDDIQRELEALSKTSEDLVEDPSLLAKILEKIEVTTPFEEDLYVQAVTSANVIPELDGQLIQIPGFVVPLEFEDKSVTQFLLVPFFGACIHVPPPPPNQIILVDFPEGLKERNMSEPIWISGKLTTTLVQSELATSAYSLQAHSYKEYF